MTAFGTAVITLQHFVPTGDADDWGEYTMVAQETDLDRCRHRPLSARELVELGYTVGDMRWKATLPTHLYDDTQMSALLELQHDDLIVVNGQDYQVDGGVKPFDDLNGSPFKATIITKKQTG